MKRKLLLLVLLSASVLLPCRLSPQQVVHDPIHMGSNLVMFLEQLQQGLTQGGQFAEIIRKGVETKETIQKLASYAEAIVEIADYTKKIMECYQKIETIATLSSNLYSQLRSDMSKGIASANDIRDFNANLLKYFAHLSTATANTMEVVQTFTHFKDMPRSDREKKFGDVIYGFDQVANYIIASLSSSVYDNMYEYVIVQEQKDLAKLDNININENISAHLHAYASTQAKQRIAEFSARNTGMSRLQVIEKIKQEDKKALTEAIGTPSEDSMNKNLRPLFNHATQLFYSISVIIFIIGAFRVYSKVVQGEDIFKSIAVWFTSALFCAIIPTLINLFYNV